MYQYVSTISPIIPYVRWLNPIKCRLNHQATRFLNTAQVGTVVMTIVAVDLAYLPIKDGDVPKLC